MSTFHLCYTSHDEVMFRNEQDMNTAFNCLCSALCKTDSSCLAYSNMSDHHHGCYSTKNPGELIQIVRQSYTKLFNNKYFRRGPLGENGLFLQEIVGLKHFLAAISYTLKNAPHHGVVASPFEYPYSSVNAYFRKELGKNRDDEMLLTTDQIKAVLPRRASFKPTWKMNRNGVFLPETVIDTDTVENAFGTVQAFNFYLGRKSGEDWIKEQADENNSVPFSIESMEVPVLIGKHETVADMLRNEKARFTTAPISDLELCKVIDEVFVPRYERKSVYHLNSQERTNIGNTLYKEYHAGVQQIKRCLVMK